MATTLDQLPIPQSRTDEFLEYLCRNGFGGGGSGGNSLSESEIRNLISQAINTLGIKISDDGASLELISGNQVLGSLILMTDQQVQTIINQFI